MMNGVLYLAVILAAFGSGLTQRPDDPCRTCEIIINVARHHFQNNITDETALLLQLQAECQHLVQVEGAAAGAHCTQIVNANINVIFNDLHNHKTARETCRDIGECPKDSTIMMPPTTTATPSHDSCRTCEIIINIARHYFNNTINDEVVLLLQLQAECQRLGQVEGANAAAHCIQVVNTNINMIYNDMHSQKSARQTCQDIGECPKDSTTMMPQSTRCTNPQCN